MTFVATAEGLDDDMAARIAKHRHDRPQWPTVECPVQLDTAIAAIDDDHLLIIDCLTLWVANLIFADFSDEQTITLSDAVAESCRSRCGPTVVVSNEVGLGVHPDNDLGRRYRDLLGMVNVGWAAQAQRSLLMVAGRALRLDDPWRRL